MSCQPQTIIIVQMTQKNSSSTWGEAFPEPAAPSDSVFLGPSTGAREGVGRKQVQTSPPELCYVTWVTAGGRRGMASSAVESHWASGVAGEAAADETARCYAF